jgi:hypothetical protein
MMSKQEVLAATAGPRGPRRAGGFGVFGRDRAADARATRVETGGQPPRKLDAVSRVASGGAGGGRSYVLPDDVQRLAPHVLPHRLVMTAKAKYGGTSGKDIVAEILQRVKVPRMNWERSVAYRYLRYLWTYRFTAGGKWVIAPCCFPPLGSATVEIPIYQIFCALLVLLCADRIAGFLLRPKLEIRGVFPAQAVAGQVVTGRYELVNRGKWTAYDLGLRFFRLPPSLTLRMQRPHWGICCRASTFRP